MCWSQNASVIRVIHQSLFFKGILVGAENPPSVTNENDESILSVICIGVKSLQDALDGYFAPFEGAEKFYQRFVQILPTRLIICFQ
jgi:hypothetical protein